jgi:3-hydroxyisobutyrate dehydrogenase
MARNLVRRGFAVRAWNRSLERAEPLAADGVEICADPREAARGCALLVTMLSDTGAVIDSAGPALRALERDAIWVQASTVGIEGIELCAELAAGCGVTLVDAPVLGTREPAERAELVVLASGPPDAVSACEHIFDAIGSRTLRLGETGSGTRCKLAVNSWILGLTAVLAETVALAETLEIDPQRFLDAIEGGPLDVPYARLKGAAMIEREFSDPAFRLALSRKDAQLVLAAAEHGRVETPVLRAVAERLDRAERAGHGDDDMAATFLATAPGAGHLAAGSTS